MNAQMTTLIAAIIAALASICTLILTSRLAIKKERRQQIWQKEIDRFFALEELAGQVTEIVGSYKPLDIVQDELEPLLHQLDTCTGRFRRYREVMQAIRDLFHTATLLLAAKRDNQDSTEFETELSQFYQRLLLECDRVIGLRRT